MRQCSGREGLEGAGWGWREGGQLLTGRGDREEAGASVEELQDSEITLLCWTGYLGRVRPRKGHLLRWPGSNGVSGGLYIDRVKKIPRVQYVRYSTYPLCNHSMVISYITTKAIIGSGKQRSSLPCP